MTEQFNLTGYGIYEFYADCGRMGSLEGVFLASAESVRKIIGKDAYFGEVLGKHSEVQGTIEEHEITLKSDDPTAVKIIFELFGHNVSGFNPFDYVSEDQWVEDEDEEEVED